MSSIETRKRIYDNYNENLGLIAGKLCFFVKPEQLDYLAANGYVDLGEINVVSEGHTSDEIEKVLGGKPLQWRYGCPEVDEPLI